MEVRCVVDVGLRPYKNHSCDPMVVDVGPAVNHHSFLEDSHHKMEETVDSKMGEAITAVEAMQLSNREADPQRVSWHFQKGCYLIMVVGLYLAENDQQITAQHLLCTWSQWQIAPHTPPAQLPLGNVDHSPMGYPLFSICLC
ncbi:hypothetical protein Nepgr_012498 [Nepenthes gracilis]|uniref:Uncharacterized protein n=1 Tax=Nepenthes gracilis TaxID=150966 RepID=A0AAD3SG83_NEPGR|nr:hypothetical protein Nepgr_012498 [Nepenthes gracilis]